MKYIPPHFGLCSYFYVCALRHVAQMIESAALDFVITPDVADGRIELNFLFQLLRQFNGIISKWDDGEIE